MLLESTFIMTDEVSGAMLSAETVRAAANLDETISTLMCNFGKSSDYFKAILMDY